MKAHGCVKMLIARIPLPIDSQTSFACNLFCEIDVQEWCVSCFRSFCCTLQPEGPLWRSFLGRCIARPVIGPAPRDRRTHSLTILAVLVITFDDNDAEEHTFDD